MQLTYNIAPPAGVEGMIASYMEGTIIQPFLAEGLVPVGLLCAPGTDSMTGPPLTTVSQNSTNPGQIKALPAGLVADPMVNASWLGVPVYDATRQPYDATLGYACYQDETTVPTVVRGPVFVSPEAGAIANRGPVYVRTATSGANTVLGKFAPAAGAGLVLLPNCRFITGRIQGTFAWIYIGGM
jgi:hypothetical protein